MIYTLEMTEPNQHTSLLHRHLQAALSGALEQMQLLFYLPRGREQKFGNYRVIRCVRSA